MSRVSQKVYNTRMSDALKELYRLVLKDGVRVESFMDGDTLNVWTRGTEDRCLRYWAEFTPNNGAHYIEQPHRLRPGWKGEDIGVGIINTKCINVMRKISCRE